MNYPRKPTLAPPVRMYCSLLLALLMLFAANTGAWAQSGKGHIQVECEPGVIIYLDGTFVGVASPDVGGLIIQNVPAGRREILATKPGFMDQSEIVDLAAGQVLVHKIKAFSSRIQVEQYGDAVETVATGEVGSIVIQSLPVQCEVVLETHNLRQNKTRDILSLSNVPVGDHVLQFIGLGKTLRQEVTLEADATVNVMVNFIEDAVHIGSAGQTGYASDDIEIFAGIQFRKIPSGRFMMGSRDDEQDRYEDEGRWRRVVVGEDFWMGIYPVTQEQWQAVMGENPAHFQGEQHLPVEQVSWDDCQAFITKLNARGEGTFRLPTEAEWEYACRADTKTRFYWGDDPDYGLIEEYAWYSGNSDGRTRPVGQKKPNPWGLYDMSGNVWEWCEDDWHDDYSGAPFEGQAWVDTPRGAARVVRGGSWNSDARNCRAAARLIDQPDHRVALNGFRLVFTQDGE